MRRRIIKVVFVAVIGFSSEVRSQQSVSKIERDAQAIAILTQSIAAMGGANLSTVRDTIRLGGGQ